MISARILQRALGREPQRLSGVAPRARRPARLGRGHARRGDHPRHGLGVRRPADQHRDRRADPGELVGHPPRLHPDPARGARRADVDVEELGHAMASVSGRRARSTTCTCGRSPRASPRSPRTCSSIATPTATPPGASSSAMLRDRFGLEHTTLQVDHEGGELLQIESAPGWGDELPHDPRPRRLRARRRSRPTRRRRHLGVPEDRLLVGERPPRRRGTRDRGVALPRALRPRRRAGGLRARGHRLRHLRLDRRRLRARGTPRPRARGLDGRGAARRTRAAGAARGGRSRPSTPTGSTSASASCATASAAWSAPSPRASSTATRPRSSPSRPRGPRTAPVGGGGARGGRARRARRAQARRS